MLDSKLETFLMVCEKNNFTQAAQALSLTQPAVSHHINQLERELGVKLFYRGKNGMKITPQGEIALKFARRLKALYQKMNQEIQDVYTLRTRLTVGITHTAESNLIAQVLARYSAQTPGVSMTILTDTINNLYDRLSNYELDLAFVEGRMNEPGIHSLLLDTDYLVCVVSVDSSLARRSMVTLLDLKKEDLILRLPSSGTRNLFVAHLESAGLSIDDFNVVLEVDNVATIKDLIRKDMGVSILPRSACLDELSKGKLVGLPVENLSMIRETSLLYHADFGHDEVLQTITRLYREMTKAYR